MYTANGVALLLRWAQGCAVRKKRMHSQLQCCVPYRAVQHRAMPCACWHFMSRTATPVALCHGFAACALVTPATLPARLMQLDGGTSAAVPQVLPSRGRPPPRVFAGALLPAAPLVLVVRMQWRASGRAACTSCFQQYWLAAQPCLPWSTCSFMAVHALIYMPRHKAASPPALPQITPLSRWLIYTVPITLFCLNVFWFYKVGGSFGCSLGLSIAERRGRRCLA